MAKIVKVKDVLIGEGAPKICVPMVGETLEQLKEEATYLRTLDLDIVEWRVDFSSMWRIWKRLKLPYMKFGLF